MEANKKSAALREKVDRLVAKPNENPIKLAKAIADLEFEAPGSISGVAKNNGINGRKLYYLLKIWRTFGHLDTPERLAAIGWKKLAIMAQHVEEGAKKGEKREAFLLQALDHAEIYTAAELPAILRGARPKKAMPHRIELQLDARQYKIFENALSKHGAKKSTNGRGLVGKEAALTRALRRLAGRPMRSRNRPQTSARSSQSA